QHGSGHAENHWWYQFLRRADGMQCCNMQDCRPTKLRPKPGNAEITQAWLGDDWYDVPEYAFLKEPSRDLQDHVCAPQAGEYWREDTKTHFTVPKGTIYCVVRGSGS